VNWMRLKEQSRERARLCASVVLPTPGTSSSNKWPRASRQTTAISMTCGFPLITRAILSWTALILGADFMVNLWVVMLQKWYVDGHGRSLTKG
jgi:hypothetical protein